MHFLALYISFDFIFVSWLQDFEGRSHMTCFCFYITWMFWISIFLLFVWWRMLSYKLRPWYSLMRLVLCYDYLSSPRFSLCLSDLLLLFRPPGWWGLKPSKPLPYICAWWKYSFRPWKHTTFVFTSERGRVFILAKLILLLEYSPATSTCQSLTKIKGLVQQTRFSPMPRGGRRQIAMFR